MKRAAVARLLVAAFFPVSRGMVPGAFQYRQTRVFCEARVRLRETAQIEAAAPRALHEPRVLTRLAEARIDKNRFVPPYTRWLTSSFIRAMISLTGRAFKSSPLRNRTAAALASASRSPTTSM